jgi:hypothetical protein
MEQGEFFNLVASDSSFLVAAHEMKTPLSIIRQLCASGYISFEFSWQITLSE